MNKFVFICLLVFSFSSAQKFQFNNDASVDSAFYPVPGKNADEIYKLTLQWVAENYKNPNGYSAP